MTGHDEGGRIHDTSEAIGFLRASQRALQVEMKQDRDRHEKRHAELMESVAEVVKALAPVAQVTLDVADMKPQVATLMGMRKQILGICAAGTIFFGAVWPDIWTWLTAALKVK